MSRIYMSPPHMSGREQQLLADVFASNWIAPVGPDLVEFERRFAERLGVDHAVAVSSGTAALHLALRRLEIDGDDEDPYKVKGEEPEAATTRFTQSNDLTFTTSC